MKPDGQRRSDSIEDLLQRMVRRIVERFDPESIILFGSHARGTAGPESDMDLLVVMPITGSRSEKQLEIRMALHEFRVPKDVVVTTPEDFAWTRPRSSSWPTRAARSGSCCWRPA